MAYGDWERITPVQWVRDDGTGSGWLVAINQLGDGSYQVTGKNYGQSTNHHSVHDAMETVDQRLPPPDTSQD